MQNLTYLIFFVFGIWLLVLSFFLYRFFALFNRLTRGLEVSDLKKVLEKLLSQCEANSKDIRQLEKDLHSLEEDGKLHIQKVGLVRFNPFKELGGDHSFSLALLNARDTGVIITGLHTRDRTRLYMKDVVKGKSGVELSADESKALASAQNKK